jgi:site-specific DNA-cytosine methylase
LTISQQRYDPQFQTFVEVAPPLTAHAPRNNLENQAFAVGTPSVATSLRASGPPGTRKDDFSFALEQQQVRRLTPTECERLMGWPDGWTAPDGLKSSDARRYKACGNGVVANVSEWIGLGILQQAVPA